MSAFNIVVEGLSKSGRTTVCNELFKAISSIGYNTTKISLCTYDPLINMTSKANLSYVMSNVIEHHMKEVIAALRAYDVVINDTSHIRVIAENMYGYPRRIPTINDLDDIYSAYDLKTPKVDLMILCKDPVGSLTVESTTHKDRMLQKRYEVLMGDIDRTYTFDTSKSADGQVINLINILGF